MGNKTSVSQDGGSSKEPSVLDTDFRHCIDHEITDRSLIEHRLLRHLKKLSPEELQNAMALFGHIDMSTFATFYTEKIRTAVQVRQMVVWLADQLGSSSSTHKAIERQNEIAQLITDLTALLDELYQEEQMTMYTKHGKSIKKLVLYDVPISSVQWGMWLDRLQTRIHRIKSRMVQRRVVLFLQS